MPVFTFWRQLGGIDIPAHRFDWLSLATLWLSLDWLLFQPSNLSFKWECDDALNPEKWRDSKVWTQVTLLSFSLSAYGTFLKTFSFIKPLFKGSQCLSLGHSGKPLRAIDCWMHYLDVFARMSLMIHRTLCKFVFFLWVDIYKKMHAGFLALPDVAMRGWDFTAVLRGIIEQVILLMCWT